jgi:cytochrome c5
MTTKVNASQRCSLAGIAGGIALFFALPAICAAATALRGDRPGEQVVAEVCGACHTTGVNGAPKIGDQAAWAKRASQGLTVLSGHAITGIRNMPAHGGSPAVSDVEIRRAVTYMVNASGGHWIEPLPPGTKAARRTGEQIYKMQCSKCHETGVSGAPRPGDRAAWIPRLHNGADAAVASAVHGHGAMPARGGMADLSDEEIRDTMFYMFNYGVPSR